MIINLQYDDIFVGINTDEKGAKMDVKDAHERRKYDLHVHTKYSPDGNHTPAELVKRARELGLAGIAITDHNSVGGHSEALDAAKEFPGFIVVKGIEVSTVAGHVLGFGVSETIKKGLTVAETIENIVAQGGIAVAPHPYRLVSGIGEFPVRNNKFVGIETFNRAMTPKKNAYARKLAEQLDTSMTGGSDAHIIEELGLGYTIANGVTTEDELLKAISSKATEGTGDAVGSFTLLRKMTASTLRWFGRGMSRI